MHKICEKVQRCQIKFNAWNKSQNNVIKIYFDSLKTTQNSRGVEKRVPRVVDIYNRKMGGVDLADQHIQVYDPDFRSVKLWKKLLINMILRVIGKTRNIYVFENKEI